MAYFEFDDVRRIHQPYTDAYHKGTRQVLIFSADMEGPELQLTAHELETWHVRNVIRSFHCKSAPSHLRLNQSITS